MPTTFYKTKDLVRLQFAESIGTSDTVFDVNDASILPTLGAGESSLIACYQASNPTEDTNFEVMEVVGISGNTITVLRGQQGTSAIAFSNTNLIRGNVMNAHIEEMREAINSVETEKQDILAEGAFVNGDKTKLDGIEAGAEVNTVEPSDIANFETTTQLNARDTANRSRSNHTGTQTASTISGFDTEVENNTEVSANTTHRGQTNNPHSVTKAQVGLGNADNTSDANKPVSTAQQTAIDLLLPKTGWDNLTVGNFSFASSTTITTSIDYTPFIEPGNRIKIVTAGGTFYFICTVITSTTITVIRYNSINVPNATFTEFAFSRVTQPKDFPMDEDGWSIVYTTTQTNTEVFSTGFTQFPDTQITLPPGRWILETFGNGGPRQRSGSISNVSAVMGLSTQATSLDIPGSEQFYRLNTAGQTAEFRYFQPFYIGPIEYTNTSTVTIRVIGKVDNTDMRIFWSLSLGSLATSISTLRAVSAYL